MLLTKGSPIYKRFFLPVIFVLLSITFLPLVSNAQPPVETPDMPIDPNVLKDATPSQLQNFLNDRNQVQQNPGEDIHKRNGTIKPNTTIVKDSTQKDDVRKKVYGPEDVYGTYLFQYSSIMQLSELSTPPLDYPIGVGDHIIVSLWGGADQELDYVVARD